ncbi:MULTISPECIES: LysR family transcriptional regulator [Bacillus]|uniref:LysR family transcriptional regulator n=1 Tax=Bacillus amyloliquefaciens TaxID=1390 RepID=A0AAP7NBK2_BACAM|nr:LysR family transcriptional regulator [Bacillus amyloliquefaciens]AIW32936.1 LysR family transcriptional regulator [Bacillus subtilis]AEB23063.1 transcriptional regulator CitR (LysR family) protein [Bacillus amyloliquefaciens TA208]AEB62567.1 transcriptional regulator CitR (LysR family) [Bacillus amyloliquefaciens LL3]AEK88062.1 transcriptional regulator CitR (LysR family) [Bacillus amyloliquefaciens XH7]MDH3089428.1 LysR family transcriptional regulator [Bacillus amyloliquefaciens]
MDFKWLHTFVTAAKYENFRKTAETLFLSQPTVTVHIKLLEKEISCKLFQRSGRKIQLTEEGKAYVPFAMRLLEDYENSMAELHRVRQGYFHTLTLAVSPLIADTVLPSVMKRYTADNKETEMTVTIYESEEIASQIRNGSADIGLSCLKVQSSSLTCRPLYNDPVVLVAPPGRKSASGKAAEVKDLFGQYLLLTHNHPDYWDDLLRQVRIQFPFVRTMKVTQTHITKRFIKEGLGVSFLPLSAVKAELAAGSMIEIPCEFAQIPSAGAYAIALHENEKKQTFLDFLSHFHF